MWPNRRLTANPTPQAVGCAAAAIIFLPFLIRDVCGGVAVVKCFGRWTSIAAGVVAVVAAVLIGAAFGAVGAGPLREGFVAHWNKGTYKTKDATVSMLAGNTPVMDCAAAATTCALLGALLVLLRGTVCAGRGASRSDDEVGEPVLAAKDNPFKAG